MIFHLVFRTFVQFSVKASQLIVKSLGDKRNFHEPINNILKFTT